MKQLTDQKLNSRFCRAISELDRSQWNALVDENVPFLKHEFLSALEVSNSVSEEKGWECAHYACLDESGCLIGAAPQYVKRHSYGEYVFDWSWADAYHRYGMDYYPKLVTAIPFTPCSSPRLLTISLRHYGAHGVTALTQDYLKQCKVLCQKRGLSSWHVLFPSDKEPYQGMMERQGVQYHWFNRGYNCFSDFLDALVSRKRKNIRKDRQRVQIENLSFDWRSGLEVGEEELEVFVALYQSTYLKRGQPGYLNRVFFEHLLEDMPEDMRFLFVRAGTRIVAGALFFVGSRTLYGRYWGCLDNFDALHFETCYYQGIELCIEEGLDHFDAGAQGEHKLLRGFEPVITQSFHYIEHEGFAQAIAQFLDEESTYIQAHFEDARAALPYKKEQT